jgi:hypothetical protein
LPNSLIKADEMGEAHGMYGGRKMHEEFWWVNMKEGRNLEELGAGLWIILRRFWEWQGGKAFIGLIWLRRDISGGLLWKR